MKITVETKSGAFDFECDADEPLLYAGLRQGVTLPYECATGTCGTCRARVREGDTEIFWKEAPGLSYVNLEKNELLLCRAVAGGDCTLRVPAQVEQTEDSPTTPFHGKGVIGNVQPLTHDVTQFDVVIDRPMTFEAGQFVVLETDAVTGGRAYSMVNYDRDTRTLVFVVKRKPDGGFSDWLFENDVTGAALSVFGPLGKATFHPEEDKNLLCLAGGSGVAGMMAILDRGCRESYFRDHNGYLFFGVRGEADTFYLDELSARVAEFPDTLDVTIALSDEEVPADLECRYSNLNFDTGFVHAVASNKMAGKCDNTVAYVAGPPPMVDGALRMLVLEARLPGTDIRYDKFG